MYQFWETIVKPALVAAEAQRVIEIGALRGENTVQLLDLLGPSSELHVIDPVPIFDPSAHAKRFPGRYVFHRDLSHNVLADLPPADAALVDGDHNWYTVYNELRMLRETAREAGTPLPLLILHDVCWPYGRRDLYYEPSQIPAEFRQPYSRAGLLPGQSEVVAEGGLNQHVANAIAEGGERNGVRTALDDFVAELDRPVRKVVLPIYHGLALVADQARLEASPKLVELFDRLESAEGRYELLELAESIRLEDQIQHHDLHFSTKDHLVRGARRYLDLLKAAILDLHYLENELRIEHLLECAEVGTAISPQKLGDPARYMSKELGHLKQAREAGEPSHLGTKANGRSDSLAYTGVGRVRLDQLEACLDTIREQAIPGDLIEAGSDGGGSGVFLRGYLEAYEMTQRNVWVADRFDRGLADDNGSVTRFPVDLNTVREAFERFGLLDERVRFLQGPPAETVVDAPIGKVAILRIDGDRAEEIAGILDAAYDRVVPGGFVVVDDYWSEECRRAVDGFRSERGIDEPIERIDWSGAFWRRTGEPELGSAPEPSSPSGRGWRISPVATKDLSMVLVAHNMKREAARTLYSLSSRYQQGLGDLDYEVIVIENGSDPEQRLGESLVRSFGPSFRYIDLGDRGHALAGERHQSRDRGVERQGDRSDDRRGARAHTGGGALAMLGLSSYEPAVVTTQQWYVGPGEQNEAVAKGYDADYEDRLFAQIGWPINGYRLFDIGHFIGDRDWFDGQWESNCIFVPRELLRQVGALDESFSMPGGGFVNLDFFERMANSPGVNLVTLLGEGSFHQVHGGTTTNKAEMGERAGLISSYGEQYEQLRGRRFRVPAAGCTTSAASRGGAADEGTPHGRPGVLQARPRGRHRRAPGAAGAGARGVANGVHRRLLAQRGVEANDLAGQMDRKGADGPARIPGVAIPGAAELGDRDRHRRWHAGAVPRDDPRPDRCRSGALDRGLPG